MDTLQEFIRFTKGFEYLTAIAATLIFLGFWKLMSGALKSSGRDGDESKTKHAH